VLLAVHVGLVVVPSVQGVALRPQGADLATWWGAVRVGLAGGDPYSLATLQETYVAQSGTKSFLVGAMLYPPSSLLWFLWTALVEVATAHWVWLGVNFALLVGSLVVIRAWLGARFSTVVLAAAAFTPLVDNARRGQVNVLVLLLIALSVAGAASAGRGRVLGGLALAAGFLTKLSPAALVPWLILSRRWRVFVGFLVGVLVLQALSWVLVDSAAQQHFWFELLPGFTEGRYGENPYHIVNHRNHSLLRLWTLVLEGRGAPASPSALARSLAGSSSALLLLISLCFARRSWADRQEGVVGALVVVMIITAPYAWEHHLVLAILPVAVVIHAVRTGVLSGFWRRLAIFASLALMVSGGLWEMPAWYFPELWCLVSSAKTVALLLLWATCLRTVVGRSAVDTSAP